MATWQERVLIQVAISIRGKRQLISCFVVLQVRSYPSRATLQRNLQDKINWDAYKQGVIQTVITR